MKYLIVLIMVYFLVAGCSVQEEVLEPSLLEDYARSVAESSSCVEEVGSLKGNVGFYNPNSQTWWFELESDKEGCNPACVVYEGTQETEVNWRCNGLISE